MGLLGLTNITGQSLPCYHEVALVKGSLVLYRIFFPELLLDQHYFKTNMLCVCDKKKGGVERAFMSLLGVL